TPRHAVASETLPPSDRRAAATALGRLARSCGELYRRRRPSRRGKTQEARMSIARIGDIEMYYEEHGGGDPLLLIMGLAADSQAWVFQIPAFAERFRTIAFDNRGV